MRAHNVQAGGGAELTLGKTDGSVYTPVRFHGGTGLRALGVDVVAVPQLNGGVVIGALVLGCGGVTVAADVAALHPRTGLVGVL